MYADNELEVDHPDPATDARAQLLSQPVVTTLLGMNATIEQTIRLDDGQLVVDLVVHATPRLQPARERGEDEVVLEAEISVQSHRRAWWTGRQQQRVHLHTRAFLSRIEHYGHRLVFTVDEHLFSLDLEVHRHGRALGDPTLASRP